MRILAYGRRSRESSAAEQIAKAESWAVAHGHEALRLAEHRLDSKSREYPPRDSLIEVCRRRVIEGVVLVDLAGLGPDLGTALSELARAGAYVLVLGDEGARAMQLGPAELAFASEVAGAAERARRLGHTGRRRICPPRVQVDVATVRARQAAGATLAAIAAELGVSRGALVRRLGREAL